jgi:hypothetical protein
MQFSQTAAARNRQEELKIPVSGNQQYKLTHYLYQKKIR